MDKPTSVYTKPELEERIEQFRAKFTNNKPSRNKLFNAAMALLLDMAEEFGVDADLRPIKEK